MFGGDEGERPPDQRVGDRVVVAVEAQVRSLAGTGRVDEITRTRMHGQREQARPFLVQGVADVAAGGIAGHGALMRGVGDPLGELGIEVVDGGEAARGEERVAKVLDHPLDPAFLQSCRLQLIASRRR